MCGVPGVPPKYDSGDSGAFAAKALAAGLFPAEAFNLQYQQYMGGCQNYGPYLGILNIRCRCIMGIQKGTIILTNTLMQSAPPVAKQGYSYQAADLVDRFAAANP